MGRPINYGVVSIICAIVVSIIELGLTAYLVNDTSGTSATRNFFLFASIWTLIVATLALRPPEPLLKRYFNLSLLFIIIEGITAIFWFAASIAFAVQWGSPHCGGSTSCGTPEAAIAFGFILFIIILVMMIFEFRGRGPLRTASSV